MFPKKEIEDALNITITTPPELSQKRELWRRILKGESDWNDKHTPSLMLAAGVVTEVARAVTTEAESTVSGSSMGEFVNIQYQRLFDKLPEVAEKLLSGGKIIIKHFIHNGEIYTRIVESEDYFPFAYDILDNLTGVVFRQIIVRNENYYTLLERHTYKNQELEIEHTAYISNKHSELGRNVPLDIIPEWSGLDPYVKHFNVDKPWFTEISLTDEEPIFAKAVKWIEQADIQMSRMIWEFKGGELAVFASVDTLLNQRNANGDPILNERERRLFRTLRSTTSDNEPLIETFSPILREAALNSGLNAHKRIIEDICGLSRATFSDPQIQNKTATEVNAAKPRFYNTVSRIQKLLQVALLNIAHVMADIAWHYNLAPQGKIETAFFWDDTTLISAEEKRKRISEELDILLKLQQIGAVSVDEIRAYYIENSDYFSKITPDMVKKAREGVVSVYDNNEE